MHDLRDDINANIAHHFHNTGNSDLANTLDSAMQKWGNLKELYFGEGVPIGIKKLVGPNREIPNNIMNVVSKRSEAMDKLKQANPFISENLTNASKRENALKTLKTIRNIGLGSVSLSGHVISMYTS